VVGLPLAPAENPSHSQWPCDSETCSGDHHHPTGVRNGGWMACQGFEVARSAVRSPGLQITINLTNYRKRNSMDG
jgi:hypothetical protein